MILRGYGMRNYVRLDNFLNKRAQEIYPEPIGDLAVDITNKMIPEIFDFYKIKSTSNSKVLDIGCGDGFALEIFHDKGCVPLGVSFGEDAKKARERGFEIIESDMSFLDFDECFFDVIWCRHVLEHSVFPYFTLCEIYRFLKPGGIFYIEVPAPETSSAHETNPNHYSVFSKKMWESLISRSGLKVMRSNTISFRSEVGPDENYAFDGKRE